MKITPFPCRAPGCPKLTTGHSQHCNLHRLTRRRCGHALQRSITKGQLKPYLEDVQRYRDRFPTAPFWAAVETLWRDCVKTCSTPGGLGYGHRSRHANEAAEVVRNLALKVSPWDVSKVALGLALMGHFDGRQFHSDTAYTVQFSRCLRRLAPNNYRSFFNSKTGRTSTCLQEMRAQSATLLGAVLTEAFGAAGLAFSRWVEQRETAAVDRKKALQAVLTTLPTTD
jgi:hypothetical protein